MYEWIAQAAQDARSDVNSVIGYNKAGKMARKGMRYDRRQERHFYNIATQERGLTPQEYYGSPAPGGSSTAGVQMMGNAHAQNMQALGDAQAATQLGVAKIQADAQKYSADKAAGEKSADRDQRIKEYENIHLPQAQEQLKKTRAETEKIVNDVATSDPKFVRAVKLLSMGPANMAATIVLEKYGVKDPAELEKLSTEEKRLLLTEMLGNESVARKEIQGLIELSEQKLKDWISPMLGNKKGSEEIAPGVNVLQRDYFDYRYGEDDPQP
ncbi:MAG: hypothetical protein HKN34_03010 [Gammaproteobacteria bacterium]|nr:hypothetical protein [Gammaproteobacteria bacterium]